MFIAPAIENWNGFFWVNLFVKGIMWGSPFLCAVIYKNDHGLVSARDMFCSSFPVVPLVAMVCASVCFLYTVRTVAGLQNTMVFWNWRLLILSVSAGVIEELSFRGFFFNQMASSVGVFYAAIINGVIFALYHYPGIFWYPYENILSLRFLMLFMVGVIFCLAFAKWKNVWLTIIVHTVWNFISYLWALAG